MEKGACGTVESFRGISIQACGPADLAPQELKSRHASKDTTRLVLAEFISILLT
jgi:hypothetical protein